MLAGNFLTLIPQFLLVIPETVAGYAVRAVSMF